MKSILTILTIIILSFQSIAQDIWFIHPSNGETLNDNFSETQVAVNIRYNNELSMSYYYVKLITHSQTYNSRAGGIPQWLYLPAGTYTWKLELWEGNELGQEYKTAETTITFYIKFNLSVKNDFGTGTINIDGVSSSSGSSKLKLIGENLAVGAIDQHYNNYNRVWNTSGINNSNWQRKRKNVSSYENINGATSRNHNYLVQSNDNYATIQAVLKKECNISFGNQFSGTTETGEMYINGSWKNAPSTEVVVEQNQINVNAKQSYIINGIVYDFEKWSDNVTNFGRSIYPTSHNTYTAIYKGTPAFENVNRNLTISGTGGSNNYVKLTWNDHPNEYVTQYHIYRYYKHNGVVSSPVHIATRNRGTLSFTDVEYTYNPGSGDFILWYDVKAYYSLEGTISPSAYVSTKGDQSGVLSKLGSGEEITHYDISNYPNPYNPQTTIRFQLPYEGFVTIKVYDAIGKEVATLLNEEKDSGIYELRFNGIDLPSGMYIYTIKVNDYFASKKMLLVK